MTVKEIMTEVIGKIYTSGEKGVFFMIAPDSELYVETVTDETASDLYVDVYIINVYGIETFSQRVLYKNVAGVARAINKAIASLVKIAA